MSEKQFQEFASRWIARGFKVLNFGGGKVVVYRVKRQNG